ncbi:MAG TPA: HupE/UreJ family protein [Lacunisphaera sp.]|nr:HupE/UreJ family protein [Lacunisphaera sp.]
MLRKFSPPFRLAFAALLCVASSALRAHDPFEITAQAQLRTDTLEINLTMARSTALAVSTGNPEAPTFESADFEKHHAGFVAAAPKLFIITAGGPPLELRSATASLGREEDVDLHLVYPAPPPGARMLRFEAPHVGRLPYGYGNSLVVRDASGNILGSALLRKEEPVLEVQLAAVAPAPAAGPVGTQASPVPARARPNLFSSFLRLGVEHILTGYDHLLFLFGLLVACQSWRRMLVIITCFTLAHSITLTLAAFGLVAIPSRIVEPLIAASILFVGIENLLRHEEPPGRWLLTLAFGLIHGFGFAGALREAGLGLSGAALGVPLFSFNLGVELGQLAVVAVVFPLLLWLRTRPAFVRFGPPALSVVVAAAGGWWLLQRTILA